MLVWLVDIRQLIIVMAPAAVPPGRTTSAAPPGNEARSRRFVIWFLATFGCLLVVIGLTILLLDPYDSGRFPTLMPAGVVDASPRTANVSRGRDPQLNAVIIGNSHVQLIDPHRLSSLTGQSFVQMTVPGSGPREQMSLLGWFMRHHPQPRTIVIGVDDLWCGADRKLEPPNPFPFWLYGDTWAFLANSLELRAIVLISRRLLIAAGRLQRTDPAGYWDYEAEREWNYHPEITSWPFVDLAAVAGEPAAYPALDLLALTIDGLHEKAALILIMPPRFRSAMSNQDSQWAKKLAACKAEILRRFSPRSHTVFIDFLKDTPENRNPQNYMDDEHYRAPIARQIEREIGRAIEAERYAALSFFTGANFP